MDASSTKKGDTDRPVDPRTSAHRAMLYMAGFVFMWVLVEACAGGFLHATYSSFEIVWARYAVHLALMIVVWGLRRPSQLWRTRRLATHLSRSLLMLVMPASWIAAVAWGAPPEATLGVFWLSPLLIPALAWVLLRERPHPLLWLISATALCGAWALEHMSPGVPLRLLLLPLAMGMSFSLYVVMTRSLRDEPLRVNLFYTALGVFLVLTPFMPWIWRMPTAGDALVMVAVGVLGWVSLALLDLAASAAPVALSAPFAFLQPALASLVIAIPRLRAGQVPHRLEVGVALIGIATFAAWRLSGRLFPSLRPRAALMAPGSK